MVTLVKHEWHQHDRQYAIEVDADLLAGIYPELDEDEIAEKLAELEAGEIDHEDILNDANDNDVEIEWEFQYDDCWTDRKGGYDVTYELGDESSWTEPEKEPEPTHKCTKCRWTGQSYTTLTQHLREDLTVIEDYYNSEEESHSTKDVCPMCDSDVQLTEVGVKEEAERTAREAQWAKDDDLALDDLETVDEMELELALEELKAEFVQTLVDDKPPARWPFDNAPTISEGSDEDSTAVLPNYPAGEYTIRIWGRTREIGVSKIKKAQYDYWSSEEHEDDLSDALNESYDYDENSTPKAAQFDLPYYEYQDKHSFWGFDQDDTVMTITDDSGEEIYEGDLESFIAEAHGDNDSLYDATEEQEELYPEYLGKGYWLMWTQGGKGSCIQTTITIEQGGEFDPRKLKVTYWDVEGTAVTNRLIYDGQELDNAGMDDEHDNWRGQWSSFNVYHNKK